MTRVQILSKGRQRFLGEKNDKPASILLYRTDSNNNWIPIFTYIFLIQDKTGSVSSLNQLDDSFDTVDKLKLKLEEVEAEKDKLIKQVGVRQVIKNVRLRLR